MVRRTRRSWVTLTAGMAGVALVATGCSSGSDSASDTASEATGTEPVTLSVATFNEFGYEDLFPEYEELNPNVTIEAKKAATSNEARDNLNTPLAAGSGASDIAAICYRADLFEKAGLPTDREEVKELLGGDAATWDKYFEVGDQFVAADTGPGWFDSAGATYQGLINQVQNAYEDSDNNIIALENPEVKAIYDQVLAASATQSAQVGQWTEDWNNAFQKDGFATMLCPGWMLGVIEGNAAGVEGWDIADVFPGGGGNWGGSFLTVPAMGENQAEAKKLANWLTAPEQQIKAFKAKGTFPSQTAALIDPELQSQTEEFFNDAPTGQILANRAEAVTVAPYKGPNYFAINDAMQQALSRVDVDETDDAASSWSKFEADVNNLG